MLKTGACLLVLVAVYTGAVKAAGGKVNVRSAGVVADSKTDVSRQIQALASQYDTLVFDAGSYFINKTVQLKSNNCLSGKQGAVIVIDNPPIEEWGGIFECTNQDHISLMGLSFRASESFSKNLFAFRVLSSSDVKLESLSASNCGLVITAVPQSALYNAVDESSFTPGKTGVLCNARVTVNNCQVQGGIKKNVNGIVMSYVNDWKVTNSTVSGFLHCVEWWGGDSNPKKNGDAGNARKCKNGLVENVKCSNATGGIWGSMGQHIAVNKCTVSNCDDVGIDFEGCFDCSASNNTVSNCKNGGLATFFYNRNIRFMNNSVIQQNTASPLVCIYNETQRQDNKDIVFSGNTFTCEQGIASIQQKGPATDIVFNGNKFNNVVLNLMFNNNRNIKISDNQFVFNKPLNAQNFVIGAGMNNNNGKIEIANNKINSTVKQSDALYGICINQNDYNSAPVNVIGDNDMQGIKSGNSVLLIWRGKNQAVKPKNYIAPSLMNSVRKMDEGNGKMEVRFEKPVNQ